MLAVMRRCAEAGSIRSLLNGRFLMLASERKEDSSIIKLTLIQSSGECHEIQGKEGWSLVETVAKNNLQHKIQNFGICCGSENCQTCHVHLKPEDYSKLPPSKNADEEFVLEDNSSYKPGSSRLGCHLILCKAMNDMNVRVPENISWSDENGFKTP